MKEKTIVVDGARVVGSSKWWAELNKVFEKMAAERARLLAARERRARTKKVTLARRRYREEHPEASLKRAKKSLKASHREWYLKNRLRVLAHQKTYRASCRERARGKGSK